MKLRTIIIIFLITFVVTFVGYTVLKNKGEPPYDFSLAQRGDITEEVSLTGQVIPAKKMVGFSSQDNKP